jgi:hypothetical protein
MVGLRFVIPLMLPNDLTRYRTRFICVEPGYVLGFVEIEPGGEWCAQQVIEADSRDEHPCPSTSSSM